MKDEKTHHVAHRFAKEMILPYNAFDNNLGLARACDTRYIVCSDGKRAELIEYVEKHICELEEDIQRIYKMDAWSFLKRWYNSDLKPRNMYFLKLRLKEE